MMLLLLLLLLVMNPCFNGWLLSKSIFNTILLLYSRESRSFVKLLSIFSEPIVFKIPAAPLYNGIEIPLRIP